MLKGVVSPMRSVPDHIVKPPYAATGQVKRRPESAVKSPDVIARMRRAGAAAAGLSGIRIIAAKSVHIENVQIAGFSQNCIDVATTTAASQVTIVDSMLQHCGTNGLNVVTTAAVAVNVQVQNTQILGSTTAGVTSTATGVNAQNGSRIVLDRTMIANVTTGVNQVNSGGGAASNVFVVNSSIHNAATALKSVTGAIMGATQSGFYNCGTIFNINGGSLFTTEATRFCTASVA